MFIDVWILYRIVFLFKRGKHKLFLYTFFASLIDVQKEYLKTLKCTSKIIFYLMLTGKSQSCDKFNTLYPVGKITEQSVH